MHHRGTKEEYTEYYYYVLEAKLYLHADVQVSILTEFVENEGKKADMQDCERKAAIRLMEKLKKESPMLPICMCGDSLYACGPFSRDCQKKGWKYPLRYKPGSIPSVYKEYETLKNVFYKHFWTKLQRLVMVEATLMPYQDVIITDGQIMPYNLMIGGNMKREFKEVYMTAKRNGELKMSL